MHVALRCLLYACCMYVIIYTRPFPFMHDINVLCIPTYTYCTHACIEHMFLSCTYTNFLLFGKCSIANECECE